MRLACCSLILLSLSIASAAAADSMAPNFRDDVLPLFEQRCSACHGQQDPQQGLNLTDASAILRGGNSGPAIQIGSSSESLLLTKLVSGAMPPGGPKLPEEEIEMVRRWIDEGVAREAGALGLALVTEADVLPILQARCVVCHGKTEQSGGLDLRTQASRLAGGNSGPAIIPGDPDQSLLIQKVEADLMPPPDMQYDYAVRNPTEAETKILRQWVAAGCPPAPEVTAGPIVIGEEDKNYWAFVPRPQPDRRFLARETRSARHELLTGGGAARIVAPRVSRSNRRAVDARTDSRIPRGRFARALPAPHRSPARFRRVRRAVGPPLA